MSKKMSLYRQQKLSAANGATADAMASIDNSTTGRDSSASHPATSAQNARTKMNQEVSKAFETAFGYIPTSADLSRMSNELRQGISPSLLEKFKSNAVAKDKRTDAYPVRQAEGGAGDNKQEDVQQAAKLEWTTDVPEKSTDPKATTTDEHEVRFGFDGAVIPYVADVDVRQGLHHHGDEPEAAGYTLRELLVLMRSTMAGQQRIALVTLTAIVRRARIGLVDSNAVLDHILQIDLITAARTLMDSTSKPVVCQAIDFFYALLLGDDDAEPLEFIEAALFVHTDLFVPRCCPATSAFLTPEKISDEMDYVPPLNTMDDTHVLQVDLVYGLVFRLDLGVRLLYVLENLLNDHKDVVFIDKCMLIMAFLCRHSKQVAEKLFCLPAFQRVVKGKATSRESGYSTAQRLLKFAALASRYVAASLVADSSFLGSLLEWVGQSKEAYQSSSVDKETHLQAMQLFIIFAAYDFESAFVDKLAPVMLENVLTSTRVHSLCDAGDKTRSYSTWDFSRLSQNFLLLYQCVQFGKGIQHDRKSLDDCIALTSTTVLRWVRLLVIEANEYRGVFAERMYAGAATLLNTALLYMVEEVQNVRLTQNPKSRVTAKSHFRPVFQALAQLLKVSGAQWLKHLESLSLPDGLIEFHSSCVDVPTRQEDAVRSSAERRIKPHVLTCGGSPSKPAAKLLSMMKFIHKFLYVYVSTGAQIAEDENDYEIVREWLAKWLTSYEVMVAKNPRQRFTWHTRPLANTSGLALLCLMKLPYVALPPSEAYQRRCDFARWHCIVLSHLLPEDAGLATMLMNSLFKILTNGLQETAYAPLSGDVLQLLKKQLVKSAVDANSGIAETLNGKIDSFLTLKNYNQLLLSKGWEIMPLFSAAERYRKKDVEDDSVAIYEQILAALKFLLYLLEHNVPRTRKSITRNFWPFTVTTTEIYAELGRVLMLTSTFPAAMEQEFNGVSFSELMKSLLPLVVDDKGCPCRLDDTFSEKYAELLDDYGSTSYGNSLYAQFILVPLRADMSAKLRVMFWRRAMQIGFLRMISVHRQNMLFSVDEFFTPVESDLSVIGLYAQCLLEQRVTDGRNPLLYEILVRQVVSFVNATDTENDAYRQRLRLTLANQADEILLRNLSISE